VERTVEPIFMPDSYGYRPNKSALDAIGVTPGLFNSLYMKCNERRASRPPRVMR
jgi:hypothetical protein